MTNKMTIFFATNRNLENSDICNDNPQTLDPRFGTHPAAFRIGTAEVALYSENVVLKERMDDTARYIKASASLAEETCNPNGVYTKRGSEEIFPKLIQTLCPDENGQQQSGARRSVMVFIPGFNNSFKDSIESAATLANLYGSDEHQIIPFVFSWPSDDSLFKYGSDRVDAEISGPAARRVLTCFLKYLTANHHLDDCSSSVFLFAHSMGAYVLRFAIQALSDLDCPIFPLFDVVLLAAPDVDADALGNENKLLPLTNLTNEIVIYADRRDKPLRKAVDLLKNSPRMGLSGPTPGSCDGLSIPFTTVHCHKADNYSNRNNLRHSYYRNSIAVVKDIKAVLDGQSPGTIQHRLKDKENVYHLDPPQSYYDADNSNLDCHDSGGP